MALMPMPSLFSLFLLSTFLPISGAPPPPPATILRPHLDYREQLDNVIDALIGADDFSNWAYLLSFIDSSILPLSATFFIPTNNATTTATTTSATLDTSTFRYHIVPQRLSFSDLQLFKPHARLPTLLLNNSITITNNSHSNFTLDDSLLTHPDVYANDLITVHGVSAVLDYKLFGGGIQMTSPAQTEEVVAGPVGIPAAKERSDAGRINRGFAIVSALVWAVLTHIYSLY